MRKLNKIILLVGILKALIITVALPLYAIEEVNLNSLAEAIVQSLRPDEKNPDEGPSDYPFSFTIFQESTNLPDLLEGIEKYGILNRHQTGTTMLKTPDTEASFVYLDHLELPDKKSLPSEVLPKFGGVKKIKRVKYSQGGRVEIDSDIEKARIYFKFNFEKLKFRMTFTERDSLNLTAKDIHLATHLKGRRPDEWQGWGTIGLQDVEEIWVPERITRPTYLAIRRISKRFGLKVYQEVYDSEQEILIRKLIPELSFDKPEQETPSHFYTQEILLDRFSKTNQPVERTIILNLLAERGWTEGLPGAIQGTVKSYQKEIRDSLFQLVTGPLVSPRVRAAALKCLIARDPAEFLFSPEESQKVLAKLEQTIVMKEVKAVFRDKNQLFKSLERSMKFNSDEQGKLSKVYDTQETRQVVSSHYLSPSFETLKSKLLKTTTSQKYFALLRHGIFDSNSDMKAKLVFETVDHLVSLNPNEAQLDEILTGKISRNKFTSAIDYQPGKVSFESLKNYPEKDKVTLIHKLSDALFNKQTVVNANVHLTTMINILIQMGVSPEQLKKYTEEQTKKHRQLDMSKIDYFVLLDMGYYSLDGVKLALVELLKNTKTPYDFRKIMKQFISTAEKKKEYSRILNEVGLDVLAFYFNKSEGPGYLDIKEFAQEVGLTEKQVFDKIQTLKLTFPKYQRLVDLTDDNVFAEANTYISASRELNQFVATTYKDYPQLHSNLTSFSATEFYVMYPQLKPLHPNPLVVPNLEVLIPHQNLNDPKESTHQTKHLRDEVPEEQGNKNKQKIETQIAQ